MALADNKALARLRVKCPRCHQEILVNRNGRLRRHLSYAIPPPDRHCPGSDMTVAAVRAELEGAPRP